MCNWSMEAELQGTVFEVPSETVTRSHTNRSAVYVKGAHDVPLCDGISNSAIWTFIKVHRIDAVSYTHLTLPTKA